ncbi:2-C-methyl-D-erythritol 4-phosphate cytidylyltransferase [Candidatus Saganbacteria bacterium]|uniref:2-C-methyl-D-erythritol 4-phosphate cytidylyltransferase n=1 Tax=Candidatus Saganbacteria bacterium TaxID=2575572 RepID=A0A9D6ULG6_UNCSA|nr:2-C-methyl-D-erythritol 4-phosphate cytidylyltransferase [Candidatus Saganbacteria bacterium]
MKTIAIIVAGGEGRRMGRRKQFLRIAGKPMLEWTLSAFQKAKIIDGIILVAAKEQFPLAKKLCFSKIIEVVEAGAERQDSVKNGLKGLPESVEIVVIHDGARPGVKEDMIDRSVRAARKWGAAVVGVPVKDTVKKILNSKSEIRNNVEIIRTIDRDDLWVAQTPQAFRVSIIKKAYAKLRGEVTDDAMAVEKLGLPVKMIMGSYANLKVTTLEDMRIMEGILTHPPTPSLRKRGGESER